MLRAPSISSSLIDHPSYIHLTLLIMKPLVTRFYPAPCHLSILYVQYGLFCTANLRFCVAQAKNGDGAQVATRADGGHCIGIGVLSLRTVFTHDLHQPFVTELQRR
jgi:hypothetical protein